jgi:hypothetical protein
MKTEGMVISAVLRGQRPPRPENMTDDFWILVNRCWDQQPSERPKAIVVVNTLKEILRRSALASSPKLEKSNASTDRPFSVSSDTSGSTVAAPGPSSASGTGCVEEEVVEDATVTSPAVAFTRARTVSSSRSGISGLQRARSSPTSSRHPKRSSAILEEAEKEKDDENSDWQKRYYLRPIRAHADPSRVYLELSKTKERCELSLTPRYDY